MSVPNQKIIVCDTWEGRVSNGAKFSTIIHSINDMAMSRLSGSGYKLYMYLCCNKKGFNLELSPVAVYEKTGMGKSAYNKAVKELMKEGFLSLIHGNKYQFSKESVDRKSVDRKSVDRKPDDGKPDDEEALSLDNHMTGSMVSGGPSPENHMTGSMVSGGEIYTDNTIIYTDNNIGVYPFEGDNIIAREKTNNADSELPAEIALALIVQSGNRYSPKLFGEKLRYAKTIPLSIEKVIGDPDFPVWKYICFEDEAAYRAAVEQGKSQMDDYAAAHATERQTTDTPDFQYDDDDELPF